MLLIVNRETEFFSKETNIWCMMLSMETDFITWLTDRLDDRGWSNSELARRAGVVPSTISMTLSGQKQPGIDLCIGIAKAFDEQPEYVLRLAGLLPPIPVKTQQEESLLHYFRQLPPGKQQAAIDAVCGIANSRMDYSVAVVPGQADPEMAEATTVGAGRRGSLSASVGKTYGRPGPAGPVETALASTGPESAAEGQPALQIEQTFYPQGSNRDVLLWLLDQVAKLAEPEDMEQVTRMMERWQRERGGTSEGSSTDARQPRNAVDDSLPGDAPPGGADER